jgi:hypothetical protein
MPSVRFPAYTSRESRPTRPAGLGLFFCFAAVTCYAIVLATVGSPAFSAYFDSGGKPVDLAAGAPPATGLLTLGAALSIAAIIRGGGYSVRAAGIALLGIGGALVYVGVPLVG